MVVTFKQITGHFSLKLTLAMFLMAGMFLGFMPVNATPFAYVSSFDSVAKVDAANNTVLATITGFSNPEKIAITPDGTRAYVANFGSDFVSVLDTTTNTVTNTINVKDLNLNINDAVRSLAITPDGSRVYVTTGDAITFNGEISIIDTATNSVISTIPLGVYAYDMVFTPDGTRAYVGHINGDVSVINTFNNTVINTISLEGRGLAGLAVTPDGSRVYIASSVLGTTVGTLSGDVSVINTATNEVEGLPIITSQFYNKIALNPDGSRAYVWGGRGPIWVIDTVINQVVGSIFVNGGLPPNYMAIFPDGRRAYINTSGFISVLDTLTNTIVDSFSTFLGGGSGFIAFTPIPALLPYSKFSANVELEGLQGFKFKAFLTMGSASNGIAPLTEPVTLQVGSFTTTIPAGAFKKQNNGIFKFEGKINGVRLEAKITPLGGNRFAFKAEASNANLTGVANPVPVTLTIGNDSGNTSATVRF